MDSSFRVSADTYKAKRCKLMLSCKLHIPLWRCEPLVQLIKYHLLSTMDLGSCLWVIQIYLHTFKHREPSEWSRLKPCLLTGLNSFWDTQRLGGQRGKEIIKPEKMHASLFGIKTWTDDNVQQHFSEWNAGRLLSVAFLLYFLSLSISAKCHWERTCRYW